MTPTWADAEPNSTLTVRAAPETQKVGAVPTAESGEFRTKEVCAPGRRVKAFVSKVRGLLAAGAPAGPPTDHMPGPPDVMLHGAAHAGAVDDPVFVPANTTWQVAGVQEMGLPPLFLTEIETAEGEVVARLPALVAAPTTAMLAFDVELLTRL